LTDQAIAFGNGHHFWNLCRGYVGPDKTKPGVGLIGSGFASKNAAQDCLAHRTSLLIINLDFTCRLWQFIGTPLHPRIVRATSAGALWLISA